MRITRKQIEIIKNIAKGTLMLTSFIAPNIALFLKSGSPNEKYYTKRIIKRLEDEDIIILAGEKVKLTKRGKALLAKIELNDIVIPKSDRWDGVWHLVSYDIPEKKKKERDYFRKKIVEFGFKQIQDSLWVFPWECKEEIGIVCQNLGISPYVAYLNTTHLPLQNKLLKSFGLGEYLK